MTLQKNTSIHYELIGPRDAPVLVLSHALGTNLTLWDRQVEPLGGSFRILRYDTRGHGKSPAPSGPYALSLLASDIVTLLDELGVTRAHFCGVSMGGMIGQYLAVHHPERIAGLVLSNTAAKIGTAEKWDHRIRLVSSGARPSSGRDHYPRAIGRSLRERFSMGYRRRSKGSRSGCKEGFGYR